MKFRPRLLDEIIGIASKFPKEKQDFILDALRCETGRLKRGDYTPVEKVFFDAIERIGTRAAEKCEEMIISILKK